MMSTAKVTEWLSSAVDTLANMMSSETKTVASNLTIKESPYNPSNRQHREFIDEQIKRYNESFDALWNVDKKAGMIAAADFILWCTGYIGSGLSLVGYIGLYFYANQYLSRQTLSNDYQQQLRELVKIYFWCRKGHGGSLIMPNEKDNQLFEPYFKLLETLTRVVSADELELLDLYHYNFDNPNKKLREVLSNPPHQLPFPPEKERQVEKSAFKNMKLHRLFDRLLPDAQRLVSEAPLVFYGYEPTNEDKISVNRLK